MSTTTIATPRTFAFSARLLGFWGLMKVRLNSLVLFAVGAGYVVASRDAIDLAHLTLVSIAVMLAACGTSALNMAVEWERDRRMERTRLRPIPAGIVSQREAILFGGALSLAGLGMLAAISTTEAVILTATTLVSYVALYTPLKTRSTWNTLVGAFPGALPPLIGWAAVTGRVPVEALSLFLIIFFWQFPHFFAIASLYRDDYRRGGFRMLPVMDRTGLRTAHRVVSAALILIPVSLLPAVYGLGSTMYIVGALALTTLYLAASVQAAVRRNRAGWRLLLWTSFVHLPGVFLLLVLERLWI